MEIDFDKLSPEEQRAIFYEFQSRLLVQVAIHQKDVVRLQKFEAKCSKQEKKIAALEELVNILKRWRFGKKSEKWDSRQLSLFDTEPFLVESTPPDEKIPVKGHERAKKGHGRNEMPPHLPEKTIEFGLADEEKNCPDCGKELKKFAEDVSKLLEFIPAILFILKIIKGKYSCSHCGTIKESWVPPKPIEKGMAGPGLLAYLLVAKYADHLPLNRLSGIFARDKVLLSRSTLCDWISSSAKLLKPIAMAMKRDMLSGSYIRTDDTTIKYRVKGELRKCRRGYLFAYLGDHQHPDTVYEFSPNRNRQVVWDFLEGFEGYLQTDGLAIYQNPKPSIMLLMCWAHARRKWFEALDTDRKRAEHGLALIRKLYRVEKLLKGLKGRDKTRMRREKAFPVLKEIKTYIQNIREAVLPKSPLGKAIRYTMRFWRFLKVYLRSGHLDIDNNASERALRGPVVGRKNWLFAGSRRGGENAAIIYTLIESCKRNKMDPRQYLKEVLEWLPHFKESQMDQLTPRRWNETRKSLDLPTNFYEVPGVKGVKL